MIGAIIGDIIGSTYEFNNTRNYHFPLFTEGSSYTDDTICTIAVADAILRNIPYQESILEWCRKYPYPMGAYGISFSKWLRSDNPQPYGSFGNGSAMRVSPVAWAFGNIDEVAKEAELSAKCSHSHREGIKGAVTIAKCIFVLLYSDKKEAKKEVEKILQEAYGKDYVKSLPQEGEWNETCQGTVPLAIHLFLQSSSFEDAIRKAISYGGDSDTLGAIVGSLSEAYWEIPKEIQEKALSYLPKEMQKLISEFNKQYK